MTAMEIRKSVFESGASLMEMRMETRKLKGDNKAQFERLATMAASIVGEMAEVVKSAKAEDAKLKETSGTEGEQVI